MSYFIAPAATSSFLKSQDQVFTESGITEVHALREKKIREDLTRRLRRVCANFPDEEFEQLVSEMAKQQVKNERRLIW